MNPELTFLHVHSESIGYGRLGVKLADALVRQGVRVIDNIEDNRTNAACWVSTPTHARGWWDGQYTGIFTMWEATVLPESFRENLHEFDVVLVPSQHNLDLFGLYHNNVRLVPLGVDPLEWYPIERKDSPFFNFLIGGSGPRKGTQVAFDAFQKVFGNWSGEGPIPRLIMKNPRGEEGFAGHNNVTMIAGKLEPEDEIALYAQAHCYLQPSFGEGFGLQPLQAIAQGCPTILTDAHGHAGFAHLGIPLEANLTKAAYFMYGDAGEWWEPNFDQLCEQMREVYEDYPVFLHQARQSARVVAEEWTWDRTAEKFQSVFDGQLTKPAPTEARWIEPKRKRYLVVVKEPFTCDVQGEKHYFEPGKEYWEVADIKRILFDSGRLDPACLNTYGIEAGDVTDLGLTEEQLAKLDDYTAAHAHCPMCGQRLGSKPTKADEIYEELCAS